MPVNDLIFVSCIGNPAVAQQRLLASPCLQAGGRPLVMHVNAASAAAAVNAVLDSRPSQRWLVWLHEDVFLPAGWDLQFARRLEEAAVRWPHLAVAGVYGIQGAGAQAVRAGHVLDRGTLLNEPTRLPCEVDSLDELLFAVRTDVPLRLDPALRFDFYATDLVLQAQAAGLGAAVVDAYCEHWSGTPVDATVPASLARRIAASGALFEAKWQHRLPVSTPCFDIHRPGDVQACADALARASNSPDELHDPN